MAGDTAVVRTPLLEVRDKAIRFLPAVTHDESGAIVALREPTGVHIDRRLRNAAVGRQGCPSFHLAAHILMNRSLDLSGLLEIPESQIPVLAFPTPR